MRGCFDSSVGVVITCVIEFAVVYCLQSVSVLLILCIFILICFGCTSVRTTVTE